MAKNARILIHSRLHNGPERGKSVAKAVNARRPPAPRWGALSLFISNLGLQPQAILRCPSGTMAKGYPVRDKGV